MHADSARSGSGNKNPASDSMKTHGVEPAPPQELLRAITGSESTVLYIARFEPWRVLYVNDAYESLYQTSRDELLSNPGAWMERIHPDDRDMVEEVFGRVRGEGATLDVEYRIVLSDGVERWIHDRHLMLHQEERFVVGIAEDVTQRKRTTIWLDAQRLVLQEVAHGAPLAETLRSLTLAIERLTPDSRASVLLLERASGVIRHGAAPSLPEAYNHAIDGAPIGPAVGSCGTAMHRGELVVVEDIQSDPLWAEYRDLAAAHGLVACWSVPIIGRDGGVLGSFALYPNVRRGPSTRELKQLESAAHIASIALERDMNDRALRESNERLEQRVLERTAALEDANDRLELEAVERRTAMEALRESESRYRSLVQSIPGAVYRCGMDSNWTMHYLSERVEDITGRPASDFLPPAKIHWGDILHPEEVEEITRAVEDAVAARRPFVLQYRIIHADGDVRWVLETGQGVYDGDEVRYLDGVILDITEQRMAQEALRESEQRFRLLADQTPMLIWMSDADGDRTFFNLSWRKFTGEESQRSLREKWIEFISADDRSRIADTFAEHVRSRTHWTAEYTMRGADGQERIMLDQASPRFTVTGEFLGFVGSAVDITDLRRAEAEARRREADLAHALRLATVGEMASAIAHELNQPLSAITNYVSGAKRRMERGAIDEARLHDVMNEISRLAHRGAQIITNVRDIVRKRVPEYSEFTLDDAVRNAVEMINRDSQPRDVGIRVEIRSSGVVVRGDAGQVEQVVINLVKNALEALEDSETRDRSVAVRIDRPSVSHARVEVIDNGPGVPEDIDIFEPFKTTRSDGMGLGLSISRSIIETHGGKLESIPVSPRGACFRFELPVATVERDASERIAGRDSD